MLSFRNCCLLLWCNIEFGWLLLGTRAFVTINYCLALLLLAIWHTWVCTLPSSLWSTLLVAVILVTYSICIIWLLHPCILLWLTYCCCTHASNTTTSCNIKKYYCHCSLVVQHKDMLIIIASCDTSLFAVIISIDSICKIWLFCGGPSLHLATVPCILAIVECCLCLLPCNTMYTWQSSLAPLQYYVKIVSSLLAHRNTI